MVVKNGCNFGRNQIFMNRKLLNPELNRIDGEGYQNAVKLPVVLVLDNLRSQHNIGSAFRTSDAFLLESICLCGITAVPPNKEIHKTALGAEDVVPWKKYNKTMDAITDLRSQGYTIFSVEQAERSIKLNEFIPDKGSRIAFVFGNEVKGVEQEVIDASDHCIEVPQSGTKHSLNVSVCIGVVLWDLVTKWKVF